MCARVLSILTTDTSVFDNFFPGLLVAQTQSLEGVGHPLFGTGMGPARGNGRRLHSTFKHMWAFHDLFMLENDPQEFTRE